MQYKNFEDHITRRHGVEIKGWPLKTFENPGSVGSQVELKVLLNSWQSGATYFHKMPDTEHFEWLKSRAEAAPTRPSNEQVFPPQHQTAQEPAPPINPAGIGASFIQFELPTTTSSNVASTLKKPRKARSDKGKPRKKAAQVPGVNVFSVEAL